MVILLVLERVQRECGEEGVAWGGGFEGGFTVLKHLDGTKHGQANTRQERTYLYYSLRGSQRSPTYICMYLGVFSVAQNGDRIARRYNSGQMFCLTQQRVEYM